MRQVHATITLLIKQQQLLPQCHIVLFSCLTSLFYCTVYILFFMFFFHFISSHIFNFPLVFYPLLVKVQKILYWLFFVAKALLNFHYAHIHLQYMYTALLEAVQGDVNILFICC